MGSGLYCGWLQTAERGRYGCMVYCLYDMLEFKLCCEILLVLDVVGMDQWKIVE